MIIVKNLTSNTNGWPVYHAGLAANNNLALQLTLAAFNSTSGGGISSTLTSTTFSFINGVTDLSNVNFNTHRFVAYCFAEIAGFSKFSSYTGNGSTDGPFVFCGFRPRFVLLKEATGTNAATSSWTMHDTARITYNQDTSLLLPNSATVETSNATYGLDITASGFKLRSTNKIWNESGGSYIFMAFAEVPSKYALAR
jgi:hypothetical protein